MMEKVIEVSHLTKEYKNLKAIDDLSFNVYQGEILGLLGPNGCGKSTTINSILSLLKYQEGSIKVFGKEMKPDSYDLKAKIGVIFQEVAVFDELNVYDNINYFCGLYIRDKKQTILQFVMDEIKQNKKMIEDLTKKQIEDEIQQGNYNFNVQQIVHDILQKLNNQEVSLKDTSSSHLSYMQIEYYTLIAMACMYGGMLGLTAINNQLANMSAKGKRVSVSPNKKGILVLSSALGSYLVSLVGLSILLIFLKFGLNVEFGNQWLYIIILSLVSDLAGISMGIFIASVFRISEQAKTGINIAISMFFSVLSGMMGVTLKYVIDKNIPIINLINPNNLITDGFYALYYYNTFNRYIRDICCLGVFIIVCLFISFRALRREQYDYI